MVEAQELHRQKVVTTLIRTKALPQNHFS